MRLTTAGQSHSLTEAVVGRVTTVPRDDASEYIFVTPALPEADVSENYRAILTPEFLHASRLSSVKVPVVHGLRHFDHWRDGDIAIVEPGGFVRTIYRPDSEHNSIFVTERCNSNCLMCSQPPKDHDDFDHFLAANLELIRLVPSGPAQVGITGGEPTLLGEKLFTLVRSLRDYWPRTDVHMLTNGRRFAWADFTREFASLKHASFVLGIPLYADDPVIHDFIVQARHAFDQTVLGMHQLARWHQQIELRVVLHRLSIPRLVSLAHYIYRNLPFVGHIALMGLEPTGYTPRNRDVLWIDAADYQNELEEAVEVLSTRGLCVSIYNHQLCVLRPSLWGFARKSISDWKTVYLPECDQCGLLNRCGGLFASATKMHSVHIHPLPSVAST